MANKYISTKVENQLPAFVREDYTTFVTFLKYYYEYLEQVGYPVERIFNLTDYRDIDESETFIDKLASEFLHGIPGDTELDRAELIKNVLQFYKAKGSDRAFKTLWRIFFNEEVTIYNPAIDVIRASDSTWTRKTVIRVTDSSGSAASYLGQTITGQTSGATARVIGVEQIKNEIKWRFGRNQTQVDPFGEDVSYHAYDNYTIVNDGTADIGFEINNVASGFINSKYFKGSVYDGLYIKFRQIEGDAFTSLFSLDYYVAGDLSYGTRGVSQSLSNNGNSVPDALGELNTVSISLNGNGNWDQSSNVISSLLIQFLDTSSDDLSAFEIEEVGVYETDGTSATNYPSNAATYYELTLEDVSGTFVSETVRATVDGSNIDETTVAVLSNVAVTTPGSGHTVDGEFYGTDEEVQFQIKSVTDSNEAVSGAIKAITIIDPGVNPSFVDGATYTIGNATVTLSKAYQMTYPGTFDDTTGHVSSDQYIHDGYFYQDYSYRVTYPTVIADDVEANKERIETTIHPAGMMFFGQQDIDLYYRGQPENLSVYYPNHTSPDDLMELLTDGIYQRSVPVSSNKFPNTLGWWRSSRNTGEGVLEPIVQVEADTVYTVELWALNCNSDSNASPTIRWYKDTTGTNLSDVTTTSGWVINKTQTDFVWTKITQEVTSPSDAESAKFEIDIAGSDPTESGGWVIAGIKISTKAKYDELNTSKYDLIF